MHFLNIFLAETRCFRKSFKSYELYDYITKQCIGKKITLTHEEENDRYFYLTLRTDVRIKGKWFCLCSAMYDIFERREQHIGTNYETLSMHRWVPVSFHPPQFRYGLLPDTKQTLEGLGYIAIHKTRNKTYEKVSLVNHGI
jgi:hypothetical protein